MSTFDHIWKKLGGRKLVAFILSLGAVVALATTGHFTDTVMWAILGLFSAFSGGNLGEHIASAIGGKKNLALPEASPVVEEETEAEKE